VQRKTSGFVINVAQVVFTCYGVMQTFVSIYISKPVLHKPALDKEFLYSINNSIWLLSKTELGLSRNLPLPENFSSPTNKPMYDYQKQKLFDTGTDWKIFNL
jgi:hypothetical protein